MRSSASSNHSPRGSKTKFFHIQFSDLHVSKEDLKEVQVLAEWWRVYYNTRRPHSSLGYKPPAPEARLTEPNAGHGKWKAKNAYHFSTPRPRCLTNSITALH